MQPARYALRRDDGMLRLAECHDLEGFFVGRETAYDRYENPGDEPDSVRATLRRVRWFDAVQGGPTRTIHLGDALVEVLDADGRVMGDYDAWDARVTLTEGSPDALLTAYVGTLPGQAAEWVWDSWRAARPAQRNLWAELPVGQREAWTEVAQTVHFRGTRQPYPALADEIELDGRHVQDLASFFCAIGEAVNGPGGYCGSSLAGMSDLLQHATRPGAQRPRLIWRNVAVAEHGLARILHVGDRPMSYFALVVTVLTEDGIDVVRA
jgi:hypothetical protein